MPPFGAYPELAESALCAKSGQETNNNGKVSQNGTDSAISAKIACPSGNVPATLQRQFKRK